jgi:hypothetical protein
MVAGLTPDDMEADFNENNVIDIGDAAKISWFYIGKNSSI